MSRRRTWDGIPQRPHPKVRHGEVPIARTDVAKGVTTSSLSMNPRIGKESWDLSLKTPAELRDGPVSWSQSMNTYLYNATAKAIAEGKPKREWPNYDAATISLVTNKMEKVLYDPERWQNQYRFLLLWKTPKHITLACQFCRKMSTLEYATLEPRDGRRLHWFFHHHLGGGIADQGQRRHN